MAIQVDELFTEKSRKYSEAVTSSSWQQAFMDACNYTLGDIDELLGTSTSRIDSVDNTEIDLDEQDYRVVISFGIDFYLGRENVYSSDNPNNIERQYMRKLHLRERVYKQSSSVDLSPRFGTLDS